MSTSPTKIVFAVTDPITAMAFLRGQLAYLKSQGFDCFVACADTPELRAFATSEGAKVLNVPLSRKWFSAVDLFSVIRAVSVLRRHRPEILNYSTPKAALVWAVASWFARPAKVVFLLRGLRLEGQRPWSFGFAVLWLMEFIAARSADVTVAVSASLRSRAIELRLVPASSIKVLGDGSSNGVDTARFSLLTDHERRKAKQSLDLPPDTFVVGYVGRFARDKGLRELLGAVAMCVPDLNVVCVLVGYSEKNFDIVDTLNMIPGAARATYIRPASGEIERELAAFDVLVLPSYREGMSNVLLEAQARGIACITTDRTGCADALIPGVTGVVVPAGDPTALSEAIQELYGARDAGALSEMGLAGRNHVSRRYRSEDVWRRYAAFYSALLQDPDREYGHGSGKAP